VASAARQDNFVVALLRLHAASKQASQQLHLENL
jgi:hypothetical protein